MSGLAPEGLMASASSGELPPQNVIFGTTWDMQAIRDRVHKIASANIPVLIEGESGTGKDLIARLIHVLSPWESGPYVKVNCPAIPGSLLESELFGYERGAFTGAYGAKPGRVELAHRGTLFLDEISELDFGLQSKLLQLLQDGQFCRIGAQEDKRVEVRVVCATNRRLEREVEKGTFRQDLYYRINVVSIHVPALRQRKQDIEELANYFLQTYKRKFDRSAPPLSSEMMSLLKSYHWPGNIRELENVIKRFVIFGSEDAIRSELKATRIGELSAEIPTDGPISLKALTKNAVKELESRVILNILEANHWNRRRTARVLNISYRALLYKLKQAGMVSPRVANATRPANSDLWPANGDD